MHHYVDKLGIKFCVRILYPLQVFSCDIFIKANFRLLLSISIFFIFLFTLSITFTCSSMFREYLNSKYPFRPIIITLDRFQIVNEVNMKFIWFIEKQHHNISTTTSRMKCKQSTIIIYLVVCEDVTLQQKASLLKFFPKFNLA